MMMKSGEKSENKSVNKLLSVGALALGLFFCANCGVGSAAASSLEQDDVQVGVRFYTAQVGDNFQILGKRIGFEAELLAAMNSLSPGYSCMGGEVLRLPVENSGDVAVYAALASRGGSLREGSGGKIWLTPVSGVKTSAFASSRSSGQHHGLDIAAAAGTDILAGHSGTVVEAGWKSSVYGYAVLLDHGNGWQTLYAHCSKVLVQVGDVVQQGQRIALVGSTGNSTGPHLHLELRKDGVYLDPARYFSV
jgi:murein DD-endopeptidase MepM/ murein hydrolase activator NlpD